MSKLRNIAWFIVGPCIALLQACAQPEVTAPQEVTPPSGSSAFSLALGSPASADHPDRVSFDLVTTFSVLDSTSGYARIVVKATGRAAIRNAEVQLVVRALVAPDSIGRNLDRTSGVLGRVARAMDLGGVQSASAEVSLGRDGLFYVLGLARIVDLDKDVSGAPPLRSQVFDEHWLLVAGGRVQVLDSLSLSDVRRATRTLRSGSGSSPATSSTPASLVACDTWHVQWYDAWTLTFLPVAGAPAWGDVVEDQTNNPVGSWNAVSDANGDMSICAGGNGTSYQGGIYLQNSLLTLTGVSAWVSGSATGGSYTTVVGQDRGSIWKWMNVLVPRSRSQFGNQRAAVYVDVVDPLPASCGQSTACFLSGDDRIYVKIGQIGGPTGAWRLAHEYGHALHFAALGGWSGQACPAEHYIQGAHNLGCAVSEGFGDFHAAVVLGPEFGPSFQPQYPTDYDLELNTYGQGYLYVNGKQTSAVSDGSITEGAVAGFLYDLWDGPVSNPPDGQNGMPDGEESFDSQELGGAYIASMLHWCRNNGAVPTGIDNLIYCMEHQVDPAVTSSQNYFPTRTPDPTSQSSGVSDPPGWNAQGIRALWVKDLYYGVPLMPAPPQDGALTVGISGKSSVRPNVQCLWDATVSGGTAPYSYAWKLNGNAVGGNSASVTITTPTSGFTLAVTVTSAGNGTGSASKAITVISGATVCAF